MNTLIYHNAVEIPRLMAVISQTYKALRPFYEKAHEDAEYVKNLSAQHPDNRELLERRWEANTLNNKWIAILKALIEQWQYLKVMSNLIEGRYE